MTVFEKWITGLGCTLLIVALVACGDAQLAELDIDEGFATRTLLEFAKQAEVEIVFDPQSVYGVKTHAVNGRHDPRSALRIMLKDTPLVVDFDEETGAYAIVRVELSQASIDPVSRSTVSLE